MQRIIGIVKWCFFSIAKHTEYNSSPLATVYFRLHFTENAKDYLARKQTYIYLVGLSLVFATEKDDAADDPSSQDT